ncbi:MAG: TlpA family protein disulfide reductase [Bdellovibrionaceae bacterium]|jgi:cytochrome c biogenesis protein CcmG, thiol:disulfide interchange protein DsbE|nr:TlpA family protein disulfide reductase [Pseudobdellovibrionaceae bacterium]
MNKIIKLTILVLIPFGVIFSYFYLNKKSIFVADNAPKSSIVLNDFEENGIPDFKFKDVNGNDFQLSQFQGKLLLLNFWATWCDPCVEEFPSMLRLIKHFKGEIALVTVSLDESEDDLNKFLKVFKVDPKNPPKGLYLLRDPEKIISKKYHLVALPETFIATKKLKMLRKISGSEDWDSKMARSFFESLLEDR